MITIPLGGFLLKYYSGLITLLSPTEIISGVRKDFHTGVQIIAFGGFPLLLGSIARQSVQKWQHLKLKLEEDQNALKALTK